MVLPTKYEKLRDNSLIIGAHIIALIKEEDSTLLDLHIKLDKRKNLELDLMQLIDTLTFLYLSGIIEMDNNNIIRLTDDTKQNIHIPKKII